MKIFLIIIIAISFSCNAQIKILKAQYTLLTINPDVTFEAKSETKIDLKNDIYTFSLSQDKQPFDKDTFFKSKTSPTDTIMFMKTPGLCYDNMEYYFDKKKDSVFSLLYVSNCNSKVLVKEKLIKPKWIIQDSIKTIGGYNTQKATTQLYDRKWTAYFTTEIKNNIAPWRLIGLPGTIIEARDETGRYLFQLEKVEEVEDGIPLEKPQYKKEMNFIDFKKYAIRTFEDDMIFGLSQVKGAIQGSVTRASIPPYYTLDIVQKKDYKRPKF